MVYNVRVIMIVNVIDGVKARIVIHVTQVFVGVFFLFAFVMVEIIENR